MTENETINLVKAIYPDAIAINGIFKVAIIRLMNRSGADLEKYYEHITEFSGNDKYIISDYKSTIAEAWENAWNKISTELERRLEK